MAMLDSTGRGAAPRPYAPAGTGARGTVATLEGCVMRGLFAETNRATERTLEKNDYRPGARRAASGVAERSTRTPATHATARELARQNIAAFDRSGAQFVAVNSAGCGAMMKDYAHLLRDDIAWRDRAAAFALRVRDVSELLAAAGPEAGRADARQGRVRRAMPPDARPANRRATACGARRHSGARPRARLPTPEQCCGGAGIYNLTEPEVSARVLAPKLAAIEATGASVVATGNPGCLMQIGAGIARTGGAAQLRHPVELLDASYAKLG